MAKIAIIDDWINPQFIFNPSTIQYIYLTNEMVNYDGYTHATIIMKVFEKYAQNYNILNIVVAPKMDKGIDIQALAKALEICLKESVDIVCMSLGTNWISEGKYIQVIIEKLFANNTILIAAADNEDNYIFPAAMREVIGVGLEKRKKIQPGRYVCVSRNLRNINFLVNCNLDVSVRERHIYPSTSYAVPVIAAKANDCLNKGCRGYEKVIRCLEKQAEYEEIIKDVEEEIKVEIPFIRIQGFSANEYLGLIDILFEVHDMECVALDYINGIQDCRFISMVDELHVGWKEIQYFLQRYTTIDIAFTNDITNDFCCEIDIVKRGDDFWCMDNNKGEMKCFIYLNDLCEYVLEVLT